VAKIIDHVACGKDYIDLFMAKILHVCTNYNLIAEIMASSSKRKKHNDEANGTRISQLLVNKGTEALRQTFDTYCPPSTLQAVLNIHTNLTVLTQLRRRKIIYDKQWDLLYPTSSNPDSKQFDVTLLSVLLWNICNLKPPPTGWSTMPPDIDKSVEANIVRIKLYRNEFYAHVTSTKVSDSQFDDLWPKISQTLYDLGIPQAEIDELETCPLSPEEENYIKILGDWKSKDDALHETLDEIKVSARAILQTNEEMKVSTTKILETTEEMKESIPESIANQGKEIKESMANEFKKCREMLPSQADADENLLTKLCKFTFVGDIKKFVELFHPGTRKWLFTIVNNWFTKQESKVFVLTAGPGVGKSVLAAKIIKVFEAKKSLAAFHFCKFNNSNYSNPQSVIQSLANQMCDFIEGFKKILLQQLKRPNKVLNLQDAFQVYLKEPLEQLPENKPMLVVIDGLDECESDQRTKLLDVLAKEFVKLPPWLKVLVTSRPEIRVQEKLCSFKNIGIAPDDKNNEEDIEKLAIAPDDKNNEEDIKMYLTKHLSTLSEWNEKISCLITEKCEGSFLFAFHLQKHLQNCEAKITQEYIESLLPEGINSVYLDYFTRLEDELKSVCETYEISRFLKIIACANSPIPLSFFTEGSELSPNLREMKVIIGKINQSISTLLYVSDDMVTVYHRSVNDWLCAENQPHIYTVNDDEALILLWEITEEVFKRIKKATLNAKNRAEIHSLCMNKTNKHVLEFGFEYFFEVVSFVHSIPANRVHFEWMVDVVILHMTAITIGYGRLFLAIFDPLYIPCDLREDEHYMKLGQKIKWHSKIILSHEAAHAYVQHICNEGPSELFSKEEKDNAKYILSKYI
jgi:hypothetical protein